MTLDGTTTSLTHAEEASHHWTLRNFPSLVSFPSYVELPLCGDPATVAGMSVVGHSVEGTEGSVWDFGELGLI